MNILYKNTTYSKLTESKIVVYCMNNLTLYNDSIKKKYKKENAISSVIRLLWTVLELVTVVFIGTFIKKNYIVFSVEEELKILLLIILASLIAIYLMEQLVKYIRKKVAPTIEQINKETQLLECIRNHYIPLFQLQEMLKKEEVENIVINENKSVLTVWQKLPNGITQERKIYIHKGCDAFMKDYMLDFSWIDKELNEQLVQIGLPAISDKAYFGA